MVKPAKVYRGIASSAVHALKHALGNGDGAAAAQEQDAADGGQAQTHGDGHAQKQQNKE
jgi:hypothetical protein